ncbi:unnamed protein product [Paramecium primaurelia]|uniref:Uncharacterized protein n=1 Tax=Paramecium primaurelia TaxID=5886 RepID=A0A8S1MQK8_PARPR|nr:unnamed protein product [Paramecium primaurelia]
MEITVTKNDGTSLVVHSKLNGDGPFNNQSAQKALEKLVAFVEK